MVRNRPTVEPVFNTFFILYADWLLSSYERWPDKSDLENESTRCQQHNGTLQATDAFLECRNFSNNRHLAY